MDKKPLIWKCLTLGIILLFIGICIIPSTQANTDGPDLKILSITMTLYNPSPYVPSYEQLLKCEVINCGNAPATYVHYIGKATRYTLFRGYYLAGGCDTGESFPPSRYWQPDETRVLDTIIISNKPFLKHFPIIYNIWLDVGTAGDLNPYNNFINRNFLIWGTMMKPVNV